eukprot:gene52462-65121_t
MRRRLEHEGTTGARRTKERRRRDRDRRALAASDRSKQRTAASGIRTPDQGSLRGSLSPPRM